MSKSKKDSETRERQSIPKGQIVVHGPPHEDILDEFYEPETDEDEESVGNEEDEELNEIETEEIKNSVNLDLQNQTYDPLETARQSVEAGIGALIEIKDQESKRTEEVEMEIEKNNKSSEDSSTEPGVKEEKEKAVKDKKKKRVVVKSPTDRENYQKTTRRYILELNRNIGDQIMSDEAEVIERSEKFLMSVKDSVPDDQAQNLLKIKAAKIAINLVAKKVYNYSATNEEVEEMARYSVDKNITDPKLCFYYLDGYRRGNQHSLMKHGSNLEKIVDKFNTQNKKFEEHLSVIHRAADQLNSFSTKLKFVEEVMKGTLKPGGEKGALYNAFSSSESEEEDSPIKRKKVEQAKPVKKVKYDDIPDRYATTEVGGGSNTSKRIEDVMEVDVSPIADIGTWKYKDYLKAMKVKDNEIQLFYSKDGMKFDETLMMEAVKVCNAQEWQNAIVDGRARQVLRQKVTTAFVNKISLAKRDARKEAERRAREQNL